MTDPAEIRLYAAVQRTLVGGMVLSFGLMAVGLVGLVLNPAAAARAGRVVALDHLIAAVFALDPVALLDLGVLVLMFIPAVHLAVAGSYFLRRGESRYAAATGIVLGLLLLGALLALVRR